jgi:hypothetical protein
MIQAPAPATIAVLLLIPLIAWRVWSRVRRMVGRQRLSRVRPWITMTIFPLLVALLAWGALHAGTERLWWLVGGLAIGALLALYGLKLTRFEPTREGLYYTPNLHLGIALSLLLVGRVLYRAAEVYVFNAAAASGGADFVRSPVTLAIFGLLAGYYVFYAAGLVRWRFGVLRAKREREARSKDD